jgi:hypothetical protein
VREHPLEIKRKFVYATQCGDVLEIKKDRYGDITHYRTDSSGLMSESYKDFIDFHTTWFSLSHKWEEVIIGY